MTFNQLIGKRIEGHLGGLIVFNLEHTRQYPKLFVCALQSFPSDPFFVNKNETTPYD